MLVQSSSDVQWRPMRERRFLFTWDFDIDAAKRLIQGKPRPVYPFKINKFCVNALNPEVEDNNSRVMRSLGIKRADWKRARTDPSINIDVPIIIWTYRKGGVTNVPIDGWHRIAKALTTKVDSLPCVVLSRRESAALAEEGLRR